MKRSRLFAMFIIISLLMVGIVLTTHIRNTTNHHCANMPDGSIQCFPSAAAFLYELSGGRMTVAPDDISLDLAIPTYNAFVVQNNTPQPYPPTPYPAANNPIIDLTGLSNAVNTLFNEIRANLAPLDRFLSVPSPDNDPPPTPDQHCANMPDGSIQCFPSVAAFIYELSGGLMTVVPEDIPIHIAVPTYNAFMMRNSAPQTPAPTPLPDGSIVDPTALPRP